MNNSHGVSEGVLLAIATATSYAAAYAYKIGYASHFNLPPVLLTPSIGSILQAASIVGGIIIVTWSFASGLWSFAPRGNKAVDKVVRRFLLTSVVSSAFIFQIFQGWEAWVTFLIFILIGVFFSFIFPLLTQKHVIGFNEKLEAQIEVEHNANSHSLASGIENIIGRDGVILIALIFSLLFLANLAGSKQARNQTDFFVMSNYPGHIAAAMEDATIILVAYDEKTKKLKNKYHVITLSESQPWILEKRKIGVLAKS